MMNLQQRLELVTKCHNPNRDIDTNIAFFNRYVEFIENEQPKRGRPRRELDHERNKRYDDPESGDI